MSLFRPNAALVRSAGTILDRTLFSNTIPITAARIFNLKNVGKFRGQMERSKELLKLERIGNVRADPDEDLAKKGGKCLLLKPEVKPGGMGICWSEAEWFPAKLIRFDYMERIFTGCC